MLEEVTVEISSSSTASLAAVLAHPNRAKDVKEVASLTTVNGEFSCEHEAYGPPSEA